MGEADLSSRGIDTVESLELGRPGSVPPVGPVRSVGLALATTAVNELR